MKKANEAPEKIYLQDSMSTDTIGDLWPEWFDAEVSDNSIEYTRTDAFIEKAANWLRTHSENDYFELIPVGNYIGAGTLNKKRMIDDFKKYMEDKL